MASRREKVGTTVVLTALIVGGISIPAQAAPPGSRITAVPDAGARPHTQAIPLLPSGRLATPPTLPTTPIEFLNAQVEAATVETQVLAERINELQGLHEDARLSQAWADHSWRQADEKLQLAKAKAAEAAAAAYRAAGELPPPLQDGSLLRDLQLLIPQQRSAPWGESAAFELDRATTAEKAARAALMKATETEKTAAAELAAGIATHTQRDGARLLLQQRLDKLKSEEELRKEREAEKLKVDYNVGQSNKGLMAHPNARKAVLHALEQLGKPYQFAEEGPTFYDCSGLTWDAYRTVGVYLPRVAKDQYNAYRAKPVALDALLPGDLLFYARDPKDWRTIHHVMIYLGKEGNQHKILHSPKTGDFVKIQSINLGSGSQVDFAVRIIDAVPVPADPPPPPPPPSPSPSPSPTPTPSPTVTATTSPA